MNRNTLDSQFSDLGVKGCNDNSHVSIRTIKSKKEKDMIPVKAHMKNSSGFNTIKLSSGDESHSIEINTQEGGIGSKARGGELLFLSIAACYINDIYREAKNRDIEVDAVEVTVEGEFEAAPGSMAENVRYLAKVTANADEKTILELIEHTDTVAEIPISLRSAIKVELLPSIAVSSKEK